MSIKIQHNFFPKTLEAKKAELQLAKRFDYSNIWEIPGKPLGYAWHLEQAIIEEELIAEGWDPKDPELFFEIRRKQTEIHKSDISLQEYQKKHFTKINLTQDLTLEELRHIYAHFCGANDPFVQGIAEKIKFMIGKKSVS